MRVLLDTHIAIWAFLSPHLLSAATKEMISVETNDVFVSVVSIWEIAIKRQLGRRSSPKASAADLLREYESNGINILGVTTAHAIAVETLPSIHGDPFDRLIVAQALTEPLRLLTRDKHVAAYSDTVILV